MIDDFCVGWGTWVQCQDGRIYTITRRARRDVQALFEDASLPQRFRRVLSSWLAKSCNSYSDQAWSSAERVSGLPRSL